MVAAIMILYYTDDTNQTCYHISPTMFVFNSLVPGTAANRRRHQPMKPPVEVKSLNHQPAADCAPCRRRRR